MRNKQIHTTPLRWMLRRYVFLLVAVLLISFAVFPMQGMMSTISVRENLNLMEKAGELVSSGTEALFIQKLTLTFVYSPMNLEMLCLLFGGLGFGAAMVLFRHLFSRKQAMMIASLPLTRSRDFLLRCLVYVLWCLVPLALCLAIHPLVVWGNGLSAYLDLRIYLMRAASTLLIDLYGFALGALCASVFGTFWSAGLGGLMIAGSAEAALSCWIYIASRYLGTLYRDYQVRSVLRFSPVYSMYKAFYHPELFSSLPGFLAAAVLAGIAWAAYRRVKPENAGHTMNLNRLEPVVQAWAVVLGGTAGAVVLTMYLGWEASLYVGLLLGAALIWVLVRMLLDQQIRLNLSKWKIPAAAVCLMVLVLLSLRGGWFGYNDYAPEASGLSSIRLVSNRNDRKDLVLEDGEGLAAGLAWVGQMRGEMMEERRESPFRTTYGDAVIAFEEKGGRTVIRQYTYPEDKAAVLPALRVLAERQEKQRAEEIVPLSRVVIYPSVETYGLYGEEFREIFGFSADSNEMPRADAAKMADALRLDLRARSLDTLQQPDLLNVYFEGINPETGEYDYEGSSFYQIKPGDIHVLSLLFGDDAEKWVDYVSGGFSRNDSVRVYLCEYSLENGEERLIGCRMAESEEEVRDWMSEITCCTDWKFTLPTDRSRQVKIYSLNSLRDQAEYGGLDPDLDLEDPEVLKRLPELTDMVFGSYAFVKAAD